LIYNPNFISNKSLINSVKFYKQVNKKLEKICETQGLEWYFKYNNPTHLTPNLKRMCMKAIQSDPRKLKYIPSNLLSQDHKFIKRIYLEAVVSDSSMIEYVKPELILNDNLITCLYFSALQSNHLLLKWVDPKYISEHVYILLVKFAMRDKKYKKINIKNPHVEQYIHESFRNHPSIVKYFE
jgi:hypothetical protein